MVKTDGLETTNNSTSQGPRMGSGFRSWLKTKATVKKEVKFVHENPGDTSKGNGGSSNLFKSQNSAPIAHSSKDPDLLQSPAAHRRQQVYRAQKRHRDRKTDYVESLEAEIARLRHLDAVVNNEKCVLEHQNQAMKIFLAGHNLDEGSASKHFHISSASQGDSSSLGSDAAIDVRFDAKIGHERTFLDFGKDHTDSTLDREGSQKLQSRPNSPPNNMESWEALDFILALEWPCRNHIHHHAINPSSAQRDAETTNVSQSHALTATQTVYSCALEPPGSQTAAKKPGWHLPYSEIEKLVTLSAQLPLNDDMMTPAQVYSTICLEVPLSSPDGDTSRSRIMEALKVPLSRKVSCFGFGAALRAVDFYEVFDDAVRAMGKTSDERGQSVPRGTP
ncbi:hypothetical protein D0867_02569 [Hortaea werneckii]|uniref:BZIP domain-containing protein n=1 Tax=Hortaea werneckii TaxID=91943 RepID=A0A3M7BHW7_HORWE|nr:hypothetical protein D0867_02569 [Hortaea werneckii]RMY39286.1 hypothetical protein D0866_02035 [Hortaea werneckii]